MITDYLCAVFSLDSYQKPSDNVQIPSGWNTIATSDGFNLSLDGYFGIAYKNVLTKELVIAHRGTDNLFGTDFNDDVLQIGLGSIPGQYTHAQAFVDQVKADLGSSLGEYTIRYTGHSLGAILAELTAIHDSVAAVTFESPGTSLSMAETVLGTIIANPNALPIKIYNAAPNLVNTANMHLGQLNRIYPIFQSLGGANLLFGYRDFGDPTQNGQHSMNGILGQFDPSTGVPKVKSQPITWPIGLQAGYQNFKSYDTNPHYWEIYFAANSIAGQARVDFINSNLGGINNNVGAGELIIGDASDNYIWGTTNGPDVVNSGDGDDSIIGYGGNDQLIGGAGTDTYNFAEDFGRDTIIDDGGVLKYNGKVITGTARETSNKPGTYTLRTNGNSDIFILTRNNNDLRLAVNDVSDNPINSVIMSNYFVGNDNGLSGRFGITLLNDPMAGSPEVPLGQGVGAPVIPKNILSNGNYVEAGWQSGQAWVEMFTPDGTSMRQVWGRSTPKPDVAVLSNDNIVVAWTNQRQGNPYMIYEILAEIVTPLGDSVAWPFIASDEVFGYSPDQTCGGSEICPIRTGGFQILWNAHDQHQMGVFGNVFSSFGVKSHQSFQVNTYITADQYNPKPITLKNGNIVVAWTSAVQEVGSHSGVFAQILSPSGQKIGSEFQINVPDGATNKYLESLDALKDGNFRASYQKLDVGYYNRTFVLNPNLLSSMGNDDISGGTGDDNLITFGSNSVTGDTGADIFTIGKVQDSITTITDFECSNPNEKIDLTSFPSITSFADLLITEGSAIVHLSNNQSIHIINLTPNDLSENNFIFGHNSSSNPVVTPTPSVNPTPTPSVNPTPTPSVNPTPTPSVSPTPTPSVSPTSTPSVSPTPTPSVSPAPTPSVSPAPTPNVSPAPTPNVSPTPASPTLTPSVNPTPTMIPSPVQRCSVLPVCTITADSPKVHNNIRNFNTPTGQPFTLNVPSDNTFDLQNPTAAEYCLFTESNERLPSWLDYDSTNKKLTGLPSANEVGIMGINVFATDTVTNSCVSTGFKINVSDISSQPQESSLSIGPIIGGVVGGVVAFSAGLVATAGFFAYRNKKDEAPKTDLSAQNTSVDDPQNSGEHTMESFELSEIKVWKP